MQCQYIKIKIDIAIYARLTNSTTAETLLVKAETPAINEIGTGDCDQSNF